VAIIRDQPSTRGNQALRSKGHSATDL
jgi:hypothetical protein